ncbi:MAG TPA: MgtC/SapB family protein [Gemmataceae bacterium]
MPLSLTAYDILLRLLLAAAAGAVLGLNRTERDKPAGLRTSLLVSLAAAAAMVQANILLPTGGKEPSSFAVLDLMRLPLGILTGMGFIGAGAVIHKKGSVEGVTTAATLWLATVIGLNFGGGQIGLGFATLLIGLFALSSLTWLEMRVRRDRQGTLTVTLCESEATPESIESELQAEGYRITGRRMSVAKTTGEPRRSYEWDVRWREALTESQAPRLLERLARSDGVRRIKWRG